MLALQPLFNFSKCIDNLCLFICVYVRNVLHSMYQYAQESTMLDCVCAVYAYTWNSVLALVWVCAELAKMFSCDAREATKKNAVECVVQLNQSSVASTECLVVPHKRSQRIFFHFFFTTALFLQFLFRVLAFFNIRIPRVRTRYNIDFYSLFIFHFGAVFFFAVFII